MTTADPAYPQYDHVRKTALETKPSFVDQHHINRLTEIVSRRGYDWATSVLGYAFQGLRATPVTETQLLIVADEMGLTPPLPCSIVKERAAAAAHQQMVADELTSRKQMEATKYAAALEQCAVPVEVRANNRGRTSRILRHVVPLAAAVSGRSRLHPAGRALCETPDRIKPLELEEPTTQPGTCVRCLAYMPKIRLESAGEVTSTEITEAVARVLTLIDEKQFETAETLIFGVCDGDQDTFEAIISALGDAAAARIPADGLLVGPSFYVWGNPFRGDHAWRCGLCPWCGTSYKTKEGVIRSAHKHAGEHGPTVKIYGPSGEEL